MEINKDDEYLIRLEKNIGDKMDEIEAKIVSNGELLSTPLIHRFTDGLYTREVTLLKGTLTTTKTHKVQHQFFLFSGEVYVWNNDGDAIHLQAPYIGITEANTRRLIYAIEDCIWATCHPNPENKLVDEIESIIFENYDNKLLTDVMKEKIKQSEMNSKSESLILNNIDKLLNV